MCGPTDYCGSLEKGLARAVLDGTNFTSDLPYCEENRRPLCQGEDSMQHRHWECSSTEWSRQELTCQRDLAPECVRDRGWAVLPPEVLHFRRLLQAVPDTMLSWHNHAESAAMPCTATCTLDLFTDGAARDPTCQFARLTGWAVVGLLATEEMIQVSAGTVPGLSQTVIRAEVTALLSAVGFARFRRQPALFGVTMNW